MFSIRLVIAIAKLNKTRDVYWQNNRETSHTKTSFSIGLITVRPCQISGKISEITRHCLEEYDVIKRIKTKLVLHQTQIARINVPVWEDFFHACACRLVTPTKVRESDEDGYILCFFVFLETATWSEKGRPFPTCIPFSSPPVIGKKEKNENTKILKYEY